MITLKVLIIEVETLNVVYSEIGNELYPDTPIDHTFITNMLNSCLEDVIDNGYLTQVMPSVMHGMIDVGEAVNSLLEIIGNYLIRHNLEIGYCKQIVLHKDLTSVSLYFGE